jgi:hypothetical protein
VRDSPPRTRIAHAIAMLWASCAMCRRWLSVSCLCARACSRRPNGWGYLPPGALSSTSSSTGFRPLSLRVPLDAMARRLTRRAARQVAWRAARRGTDRVLGGRRGGRRRGERPAARRHLAHGAARARDSGPGPGPEPGTPGPGTAGDPHTAVSLDPTEVRGARTGDRQGPDRDRNRRPVGGTGKKRKSVERSGERLNRADYTVKGGGSANNLLLLSRVCSRHIKTYTFLKDHDEESSYTSRQSKSPQSRRNSPCACACQRPCS